MDTLYLLLAIVWSILCLILFFKVWGMTDDVREIRNHILRNDSFTDNQSVNKDELGKNVVKDKTPIKEGDKVMHPRFNSGKDMYVGKINSDGTCLCVDDKGEAIATLSIDNLKKI